MSVVELVLVSLLALCLIAGVVFVFGPTPPKSKGRDGDKKQRLFDIGGPGPGG